jgi:hypothetical protein
VLPIVVYQGKERWEHRPFIELFGKNVPQHYHSFIGLFDYIRTDTNTQSEIELEQTRSLYALSVFGTMRRVLQEANAVNDIVAFLQKIAFLHDNQFDKRLAEDMAVYLFFHIEIDHLLFENSIKNLFTPPLQKKYMGLLEQYNQLGEARGRAEGEARGEARGRAEGRAEGEAIGKAEGKAEGEAIGEMRTSRIIKQHLKGKTNAEIAAALGCDISIVIKAIHEYDIAD